MCTPPRNVVLPEQLAASTHTRGGAVGSNAAARSIAACTLAIGVATARGLGDVSIPPAPTQMQLPQSSSIAPSQSSSPPPQPSTVVGLVLGRHVVMTPDAHTGAVVVHAPTPQLAAPR